MADYIAGNNLGESSEALAKEAFQHMNVKLDLSMRAAGVLEGWSLTESKDNQYLYYEERIVVPQARLVGCLQLANLSSGHTGCNRSVDFFRERFYSRLTCVDLRARMQSIVHFCGCHAGKQSDSGDQGLVSSLPIPYCTNSLLFVGFITGLPKFGGYDSFLVVTRGLTHFTRVSPGTKHHRGTDCENVG